MNARDSSHPVGARRPGTPGRRNRRGSTRGQGGSPGKGFGCPFAAAKILAPAAVLVWAVWR